MYLISDARNHEREKYREIEDSTCNDHTTDNLAVLRQNWSSVGTPELYNGVQSPKKLEPTRKYHLSMISRSVVRERVCGLLLQQNLICPAIRTLDSPDLKCLYWKRSPTNDPERSSKYEWH
jgi:hypothetical protein